MHWELSEEQNLYANSLREWLAARAAPDIVRAWLDGGDVESFSDECAQSRRGEIRCSPEYDPHYISVSFS